MRRRPALKAASHPQHGEKAAQNLLDCSGKYNLSDKNYLERAWATGGLRNHTQLSY
jgi:hypothetical protein